MWSGSYERCLFTISQQHSCRTAPDFRLEDFVPPQPYYPFSEDAIDYILEQIVILVPRKMFRALRMVLERAIRREGLQAGSEINAVMAEDIILSVGI